MWDGRKGHGLDLLKGHRVSLSNGTSLYIILNFDCVCRIKMHPATADFLHNTAKLATIRSLPIKTSKRYNAARCRINEYFIRLIG